MGKELEIKLSLDDKHSAVAWEWLERQPGARFDTSKNLRNIYFDTVDGSLNQRRVALRVRQAGDRYIQTLKSQGEFVDGVHRRNEWEWPVASADLDLDLLTDNSVLEGLDLDCLEPVFETNFTRRTLLLEYQHALIEVAFDCGEILAGGKAERLNEIEFELKHGEPSELLKWAGALADEVPVFLNMVSKAEQGYYLAGVAEPLPEVDGAVSVHGFLSGLSACWLRHVPMPIDRMDLSEIQSLIGAAGLSDEFRQLIERFSSGVPVNQLVSGGELGRIQLAIAGNAQA